MDIKTNIPKVDKNDLLDAVLQKLKLQFGSIDVGFFVGSATYKGGKDITTVARENNYGTKRIPARPYMDLAKKKNANEIIDTSIINIFRGMEEKQALSRAGIMFKNAIQKEITDLKEPPNAESTILKKGSSNPLIDTGLMRSKVEWKLRPPK